MDQNSLEHALDGLHLPDIRFYASIGSTNEAAMAWAEEGGPDMGLVVADHQTRGRGRFGRKWITHPGAGLAFSLILCPNPEERRHLPLFSPLGALSVSSALNDGYSVANQIKWPNDVLVRGKKLSGILAESAWQGGELAGLVLGIGINISKSAILESDELLFPATCMEEEVGGQVDRLKLLRCVVIKLIYWRERLAGPEFFNTWLERLAYLGEWVEVGKSENDKLTGRLMGLRSEGELELELENSEIISVSIGDVRLRPSIGRS
jgi:BirA family biotin operon repressor/biotin-[acetyl-CoA-carboxylase] ligase